LIDLAHANDRFFVQLAGVGFDAQIVEATDREFKKNFGPLSYVVTAGHLLSKKPPILQIEDGNGRQWEGSFVLVGNGRHYGGPFVFFPDADLGDGLLDVCLFQKVSYVDVFRYLHGILTGGHTKMPDVTYFTTRFLRVTSAERVPVEVDGELHGQVPASFSVETRVLKVIVP
jgi:diacylglycerol kinase family enzyme